MCFLSHLAQGAHVADAQCRRKAAGAGAGGPDDGKPDIQPTRWQVSTKRRTGGPEIQEPDLRRRPFRAPLARHVGRGGVGRQVEAALRKLTGSLPFEMVQRNKH